MNWHHSIKVYVEDYEGELVRAREQCLAVASAMAGADLSAEQDAEFYALMARVRNIDENLHHLRHPEHYAKIAEERRIIRQREEQERLRLAEEQHRREEAERERRREERRVLRLRLSRYKKTELKNKPERQSRKRVISDVDHKPWHQWGTRVEPIAPVVPVLEVDEAPRDSSHLLSDELSRRARAVENWAPYGALTRARRHNRRYEGFPQRALR